MRWNEAIKVSIGMKQEPGVREKTARQCQKYLLGELKTDNGTVVYPGGGHDLHNPIGFTGQKHYIFISYLSIYLDGDDGPEWQVVYKYMEKFASKAKENCNIIWMGKPALAKPRPGHPLKGWAERPCLLSIVTMPYFCLTPCKKRSPKIC